MKLVVFGMICVQDQTIGTFGTMHHIRIIVLLVSIFSNMERYVSDESGF